MKEIQNGIIVFIFLNLGAMIPLIYLLWSTPGSIPVNIFLSIMIILILPIVAAMMFSEIGLFDSEWAHKKPFKDLIK